MMLKAYLNLQFIIGLILLFSNPQTIACSSDGLSKVSLFKFRSGGDLYLISDGKFGNCIDSWDARAEKQAYFKLIHIAKHYYQSRAF